MNTRILNRAGKLPEDGYYHIEALGEHVNHASRVVQVIDEKAVTSIVNRFSADAKKAGDNFAGQRIDKDHLSQSLENPTEAMGWNKSVLNRADGIYAQIKWTPLGRPLVQPANPEDEPAYKFFSTEYNPTEAEKIGTRIVNGKTYTVLRPLRLDGLSLTNDPNNKGQHPISNREGTPAGADEPETKPMKNINKLLGLADDASEESAVAAIQKIQNRATTAEGQVTTLTAENKTLLESQVEADLEKYKGRYKVANREDVKAQLIANRKGTIALLEAIEMSASKEEPTRITNRAAAKTPEQIAADQSSEAERVRGTKIANRAQELRTQNPKLSRPQAFAKAEAEFDAK